MPHPSLKSLFPAILRALLIFASIYCILHGCYLIKPPLVLIVGGFLGLCIAKPIE